MKPKRTLFIAVLSIFLASLSSCEDDPSNEAVLEKINLNLENNIMGENTKIQGDAHSGAYFSRISEANPFGLGYSLKLPDHLIDKNIKVIIEGWARSNVPQSKATIVISLNQRDSMLSWNPIWINGAMTEPNKWSFFKDSMLLPPAPAGKHITSINVFSFLGNGSHETFDLDDFIVTFKNP